MGTSRRSFIKGCAAFLGLSGGAARSAFASESRIAQLRSFVGRVLGALGPDFVSPKSATAITAAANAAVLGQLPFTDRQDYEDAGRGFVAELPNGGLIPNAVGSKYPVWNLLAYEFLKQETAPPEANPSLWRQAQINMNNGLFEVVPGLYQVAGSIFRT